MAIDLNELIENCPGNRRDYLRRQCASLIRNDTVYHKQLATQIDKIFSLKAEREKRRNGRK